MKHFLDELNSNQKAAAQATEGPIMIIAGAGSGKTRVLTYRIAHLMEKNIDPFNILALTFTNKAAREMKDRITKIVGHTEAKNLWMGTFHSVFAKILRIEAHKIGYPSNFTIYDNDDSKNVIKEILKQLNLDDKVYKPSLILHRISDAKNKLISPIHYLNNPTTQIEDQNSRKPLLGKIYDLYQKRNFKSGAMDFDDLLFQTNILMRDFPDVLLKYQNKFRYILLDEYQDTNFSQYLIIKQLAARFQNICVVGDDAQSIYAFRGANIQNILNFEKDYPELKTYKLEQNYRSTKTIVNAANQIIANNKNQLKKTIFTTNEEGLKIKVIKAGTDNEEGQKIANSIYETKNKFVALNSDFAILYRTNAQSRAFEEALRKLNISYKIYGGISFYQRKEIKDLLSYFRFVINTNENESLRRIINYPTRGIGQSTIDKISLTAYEHDVNMWTVLTHLKDFNLEINKGICSKINDFVIQINLYVSILFTKDAFELANQIAINSGILKELYSDKSPEGVSKYENIQELLNSIKDFVEQDRTPQQDELNQIIYTNTLKVDAIKTLDEFMQEISLLTNVDKDDEKDLDINKVSLMTVHAAKGLEFNYVYIVGLEENLFPSQLSINSRIDLEEERRLFYVALTRAEKQATLSFASMRYRYGNVTYCEPSRFIDEIDENYLDYPKEISNNYFSDNTIKNQFLKNESNNSDLNIQNSAKTSINFNIPQKKLIRLNSNFNNTNSSNVDQAFNKTLKSNDWVMHDKFGKGQILLLEGNWPDTKANIDFEKVGKKSLLLKFARLNKF